MTYADFFYEVKNKFMGADVSDIHEHLAYQFDIEDEEAGGIFYVEVKEGQLFVELYQTGRAGTAGKDKLHRKKQKNKQSRKKRRTKRLRKLQNRKKRIRKRKNFRL